jgi:hypothetical protein
MQSALGRGLSARRLPVLIVIALFGLGVVLVARFATAEPMDADAGGYRIGAILYAEAFKAVPGLANLHFRFGFDSTLWPFAALTGNGIWAGQGFRLVTGLFLSLLFIDIAMRVLAPRRTGSRPGDWFIILAASFIGAIILTDSGRWVPSPAQDICVLIVAVAATGFLVDFVGKARNPRLSGSMAIVLSCAAGTLRPLGWLLAGATVAVVASVLLHQARQRALPARRVFRQLLPPVLFGVMAFLVMGARDWVLSGWLLYPLPAAPFPVSWRAADPTNVSRWITSWGRAPELDAEAVLASNDWLGPWIGNFWASRELYLLRFMAIAAVLPLAWPAGRRAWRAAWRPSLLAMLPSALTVVAWFVTAPDVRFGWAGLIGVVAVPLSFVLQRNAYPYWIARGVGAAILVVMLVTQFLNGRVNPRGADPVATTAGWGFLHTTLHLAPPPNTKTISGTLSDGTPVTYPAEGNNCWASFPLCLLPGSGGNVVRRGDQISDGFEQMTTNR